MDVQRREKNTDLLPVARRCLAGRRRSCDEHTAIGRRQHGVLPDRIDCVSIRVAEEECEEGGKDGKRNGQWPCECRPCKETENKRADNERNAGRIETHLRLTMSAQDVFHAVFQLQFLLFQLNLFDLLRL